MPDSKKEDCIDVLIDIGVLKTQVLTLSSLCNKMDTVIEKLMDQHDRHIVKIYTDMDTRRIETESDIKELHTRIDTLLDKMQASEMRIMDKIEELRSDMSKHNQQEKNQLDKLLQWKWMVVGGVLALSWLISHINFDTLLTNIK
jgi:septal ring factor EnvC (AmiA/AmiB activator)